MSVLTAPRSPAAAAEHVGRRRWRAIGLLWRPTARLVPWWHLAAGTALAYLVVWHALREAHDTLEIERALSLATIPLALSAGFAMDDPTEGTLSGTPVAVGARRALRLAPAVLIVAAAWWGLLVIAEAMAQRQAAIGPPVEGWLLPWVALSIQAAALVSVAFAAAGYGARLSADRSGGMAAAAAVLAAVVVTWGELLPHQWALTVPPDAPRPMWLAAHEQLAWLAAGALALLVQSSRDPGRSRLAARVRNATTGARS